MSGIYNDAVSSEVRRCEVIEEKEAGSKAWLMIMERLPLMYYVTARIPEPNPSIYK